MPAETPSLHFHRPETFCSATDKFSLLEAVRHRCREMHYSSRTEQAYLGWAKRFLFFHRLRHPSELGCSEAEQFLDHLANKGRWSVSTQNQTLSALHFLYGEVLNKNFPCLKNRNTPAKENQWQAVFSDEQSCQVLNQLTGTDWLLGSLLSRTKLTLKHCLSLRVKDIDIVCHRISQCDTKGNHKDTIMVPPELHEALEMQMEKIRNDYRTDMRSRWQGAYLPEALAREYPQAGKSLAWQYFFSAPRLSQIPDDEKVRRYSLDAKVFLKTIRQALR